jgi:hypothetical protein
MNASSHFFRFLVSGRAHRRRGVFIAELLLTMPAFVVFLFAIIEFGFLFANLQLVSMASRIGADAAADATLPAVSFPSAVLTPVQEHLNIAGIDSFTIRLEHNVGSGEVLTHGSWTCEPDDELDDPPVTGEGYVRVSVCVPMSELTANLLQVFGFDITDRQVSYTTVQRYQL